MTTGRRYRPTWGDRRYWPDRDRCEPRAPRPRRSTCCAASVDDGATIVAIGAFTNVARLELARPGILTRGARCRDRRMVAASSSRVFRSGARRWTGTCSATRAPSRSSPRRPISPWSRSRPRCGHSCAPRDLPRLRSSGRIGELLARQSDTYAIDSGMPALARAHAGLASDLVNFHWDPVTARGRRRLGGRDRRAATADHDRGERDLVLSGGSRRPAHCRCGRSRRPGLLRHVPRVGRARRRPRPTRLVVQARPGYGGPGPAHPPGSRAPFPGSLCARGRAEAARPAGSSGTRVGGGGKARCVERGDSCWLSGWQRCWGR